MTGGNGPEFASESEFQAWLASGMESAGWTVKREVSPDTSEDRVDIIGVREDIGTVGIEVKMATTSGAKATGEALRQILSQYAGRTYGTRSVDAWALALGDRGFRTTDPPERARAQSVCHRVAIQLGVGLLLDHRGLVHVDFGTSVPQLRIPLFHTSGGQIGEDSYIQCDMDRVRDLGRERLP